MIYLKYGTGTKTKSILLNNASLTSQAVGLSGDTIETSFAGRTFPTVGKKMLTLRAR